MAVSSLEVPTATGASGPVLVLVGEADFTSITRLDEALTARYPGRKRDAAGSAAAGGQDAGFAVRRRDVLDPVPGIG
jgi:hypothetical protein